MATVTTGEFIVQTAWVVAGFLMLCVIYAILREILDVLKRKP